MITVPVTQRVAQLTALIDTGAPLDGVKIGLFQNDVNPNALTVLADLTAATFSGYALSSAVVWGAVFVDQSNNAVVAGGSKQFTQSAITVTNTCYGYFICDGAGTTLIAAERFATPIVFGAVGKAVVVVPTWSVGQQAA